MDPVVSPWFRWYVSPKWLLDTLMEGAHDETVREYVQQNALAELIRANQGREVRRSIAT